MILNSPLAQREFVELFSVHIDELITDSFIYCITLGLLNVSCILSI